MTIRGAQIEAWEIANIKGFHEGRTDAGRDDTLVRLMLVVTEVSEAAQGVKRNWGPGFRTEEQADEFGEELADAVIRIFDLATCVGVDLQGHIARKMAKNRERPHLYGTAKAGQKVTP